MKFDFRAEMIKALVRMSFGTSTPSAEEVESMTRYFSAMTDEEVFVEYRGDLYKEGQDSMSYY